MKDLLHEFLKFVASILLPLLVIVVGAGIAAGGLALGWPWLAITGGIVAAIGVGWCVVLWFLYDASAL